MDTNKLLNSPLMEAAIARANSEARKDGMFAGLSSGLVAAILGGSKLMGFSRNKTIFCGVLTGVVSGYLFTQAFTDSNLARLRKDTLLSSKNNTKNNTTQDQSNEKPC